MNGYVDYDLLVRKPAQVMTGVYQFLELPEFQHDFDNVEFDSPAFDQNLGVDGLHRVHKQVQLRERKTVLPPELFEKYSNMMFWRDLKNSNAYTLTPSKTNKVHFQAKEKYKAKAIRSSLAAQFI